MQGSTSPPGPRSPRPPGGRSLPTPPPKSSAATPPRVPSRENLSPPESFQHSSPLPSPFDYPPISKSVPTGSRVLHDTSSSDSLHRHDTAHSEDRPGLRRNLTNASMSRQNSAGPSSPAQSPYPSPAPRPPAGEEERRRAPSSAELLSPSKRTNSVPEGALILREPMPKKRNSNAFSIIKNLSSSTTSFIESSINQVMKDPGSPVAASLEKMQSLSNMSNIKGLFRKAPDGKGLTRQTSVNRGKSTGDEADLDSDELLEDEPEVQISQVQISQRTIQVCFNRLKTFYPVKIRSAITVEEAVRVVYMNLATPGGPLDVPGPMAGGSASSSRQASPHNSSLFAERPPIDAFLICKDDPSSVVRRIFLPPKVALFGSEGLGDTTDFIRMWDTRVHQRVKAIAPPDTTFCEFEYNGLVKVKDAAEKIVGQLNVPKDELSRFGLYMPSKGIWLEDNKYMVSYEFGILDFIELRTLSEEFLLRIQIPELGNRFTLKVLPTMLVSDVLTMVYNTCSSRKLEPEGFFTFKTDIRVIQPREARDSGDIQIPFHPDKAKSTFALWVASTRSWMVEDAPLSDYLFLKSQEVEFKARFKYVTVLLPRNPKKCTPTDKEPLEVFIPEFTTATDVVSAVSVELKKPALDYGVWCLFTLNGERLGPPANSEKPKVSLWATLCEMSVNDYLELRLENVRIFCCLSDDPNSRGYPADVGFNRTVANITEILCRKLGVRLETCRGIRLKGTKEALDPRSSLLELRIPRIRSHEQGVQVFEIIVDNNFKFPQPDPTIPAKQRQILIHHWDEEPESDQNITYSAEELAKGQKVVTAGTLNKLVEKMAAKDGEHDWDFVKIFLLTYQSFTTPQVLLRKLIERYHVPRRDIDPTQFKDHREKIQLRVCSVLQQWSKHYCSDFEHPEYGRQLIEEMLKFAEEVTADDGFHSTTKNIRKNLLKLQIAAQTQPQKLNEEWAPKLILDKVDPFAFPAKAIAQQLTIIEGNLFTAIQPSEFLDQAWTSKQANVRARNLIALTNYFNKLAGWVMKSILDVKTIAERVKRMQKLINIADSLYRYQNFSSLLAFIAAFNKAPVARLKHTKESLGYAFLRKLESLEKLMSAESAYRDYRQKLHQVDPPCIPYIGVYLLDLTYIADGNPNYTGDLINFAKLRLVHMIIREVVQYQNTIPEYKAKQIVEPSHRLLQALEDLPDINDDVEKKLYDVSLELEPRGSERNQIL